MLGTGSVITDFQIVYGDADWVGTVDDGNNLFGNLVNFSHDDKNYAKTHYSGYKYLSYRIEKYTLCFAFDRDERAYGVAYHTNK